MLQKYSLNLKQKKISRREIVGGRERRVESGEIFCGSKRITAIKGYYFLSFFVIKCHSASISERMSFVAIKKKKIIDII